MSPQRQQETLLESQTILVLGQVVHLALGLAATAVLLVHTSASTFGAFILTQSLLTLFGQVIDAGLEPALVASWARGEKGKGSLFDAILDVRRFLARPSALIAGGLFLLLGPTGSLTMQVLAALAIGLALWLAPIRTYQSILVARRRNIALTLSRVVIQLVFVSSISLAVFRQGDGAIWIVVWAIALRHLAVMLAPRILLRQSASDIQQIDCDGHAVGIVALVFASIFAALFLHVDVLMVRGLVGMEGVATYGVAIRLVGPLMTVIGLLAAPLMPFFARYDPDDCSFGIRQRAILAALCVMGVVWPASFAYMASSDLLAWMPSDTDIDRAALVTAVLGFVGVPLVFRAVGSLALITSGLSRRWLYVSASALGANLLLNFLLIPRYGALGAAIATLATESLAAVGVFCCLPSHGRLMEIRSDLFGFFYALLLPPLIALVFRVSGFPSGTLRLVVVVALVVALSIGFSVGPWSRRIRRHVI